MLCLSSHCTSLLFHTEESKETHLCEQVAGLGEFLCLVNQGKKMSYRPRDATYWSQGGLFPLDWKEVIPVTLSVFSFAFAKRLYQSFISKGVKREWSLARDTKILRELPALHRPCVNCDKSLNLLMLKCCSNDIIPCLTVLLWGLELNIWDAQF